MRGGVVAFSAGLVVAGCGGDAGRGGLDSGVTVPDASDAPLLEPGNYRLEITNSFPEGNGPRLTLEPDGSFTGHDYDTLWECAGTMTATQHQLLSDRLNDADIFYRRSSQTPCPALYHLTIEGTSGATAGWSNTFTYDLCLMNIAVLNDVIDAAMTPVHAMNDAGLCTNCPVEGEPTDCYGIRFGGTGGCTGNTPRVCDASSDGELVECTGRDFWTPVVCSATLGWIPAVHLSLTSATLWRGNDGTRDRIYLEVVVDTNNRASSQQFVDYYSSVRLEDDAGTDLWLGIGGIVSGPLVPPGESTQTFSYDSPVNPSPELMTVPTLMISLSEYPWSGSPYGPWMPVTLVDSLHP